MNMTHDNIVSTKIRFFPNSIIYLLFAEYFANILSQQKQYFKFSVSQLYLIIFTYHSSLMFIYMESIETKFPIIYTTLLYDFYFII